MCGVVLEGLGSGDYEAALSEVDRISPQLDILYAVLERREENLQELGY